MNWGLMLTLIAVVVASVAAVVGLWMERDPRRPPRWAWSLSTLIMLTSIVTIATSWYDTIQDEEAAKQAEKRAAARQAELKGENKLLAESNNRLEFSAAESKLREEKMQEDLARMLVKLDEMATTSEDPTLQEFVNTEVAAQSRSNEDVVTKVAQRVADKGGDPDAMLAKSLPEEERQRVKRRIKKKEESMAAILEKKNKKKKKTDKKDKKGKKDKKDKRDKKDKSDVDGKDVESTALGLLGKDDADKEKDKDKKGKKKDRDKKGKKGKKKGKKGKKKTGSTLDR